MGGDGAESAATETATVHVDGELDHLVCRDGFAFVFGMRQARVRKVEGCIQLLACQWWVHWVLYDIDVAYFLHHTLAVHAITFFLYMTEVLSMCLLVSQTFFIRMEHDVVVFDTTRDILFTADERCLRYITNLIDGLACSKFRCRALPCFSLPCHRAGSQRH